MSVTAAELVRRRDETLRTAESMIDQAIGNLRVTRVVDVVFQLGALGSALAVGDHAFLRLGLNGAATVLQWSLAGTIDGSPHTGTCTLDVRTGVSIADLVSICGGSPPALTAQVERVDQEPTGWQRTIADPSWAMVTVLAADGALEVVSLTLRAIVGVDTSALVLVDVAGDVMVNEAGDILVFGG